MKKLFPIAMVAVVALMFTSCKKDYTCECSYTTGGVKTVLSSGTIHTTKSKAKDACNTTATYPGATISCEVK